MFRGVQDWREYLILPDVSLRIDGDTTLSPEGARIITDWEHLIVIQTGRGVARRRELVVIGAVPYPLRPPGAAILSSRPTASLYGLLLGPDRASSAVDAP